MGFRVYVPGAFGEFQFSNVMQSYAGNSVCKRSPSCFFDDHVDIWGRARRHMHDRMYPFELGIISFDVILKCSCFARDP